MKINEFDERMANAILAVNKLPSNYRVIGINNDYYGAIYVHLGRFYTDERLEDWADLNGIKWVKKPHDKTLYRIEAQDENGTILFQLAYIEDEQLVERGDENG